MNNIYPFTIGEDCPKVLVRIPVWGRGKYGKPPGSEQVQVHKQVIKDLGRIPGWG
jgi:hypothetical protein